MDPVTPKVAATAAAAQPVIWVALGYEFEAASMIAGLFACIMVRVWVSLNDQSARAWAVDVTVTGIALLFTAGWIMLQRPEPFYALLTGTGFGALGAGIIAIALKWIKRIEPVLGLTENTPPPALSQEDAALLLRRAFPVPPVIPEEKP